MGLAALVCAMAVIIEAGRNGRTAVPAAAAVRAAASPPSAPCPAAVRGLGRIAYVARGQLEVIDLGSCRVRRVTAGSAWSPQFSPDGRWLAYSRGRLSYAQGPPDHSGSPVVVPAAGGLPRTPLG